METRLESANEHLQQYLSHDEIFDRKFPSGYKSFIYL